MNETAEAPPEAGRPVKLTISEIFSRSFEIYKANPVIIVPSLIPVAWIFLASIALLAGMIGFVGLRGAGADVGGLVAGLIGGLGVFLLGFMILFLVAEGITIEMIREAYSGGSADLRRGWEASKGKMATLIVASVVAGIIIVLGYILFIIPGVILTILLYFVAQAIMIDNKGALESLSTSYSFVMANLTDAVIIILVSIAMHLIVSWIPVLGLLLSLIILPYVISLATLLYIDRR